MTRISLSRIEHSAIEQVLGSHFPAGSQPANGIRNGYAYSMQWDNTVQPHAIFVDDNLVGLYCMSCNPASDAFWIVGYLIEDLYREMGYGQTTLVEILKRLNQDHPFCNTINLSVEPRERIAARLCNKTPALS